MGSIYLIRHGQASFGKSDYDSLSELGEEQSRLLGQQILKRKISFDRVLHGSMKRHQQTAQLALAELPHSLSFEVDQRWNEFDHQRILTALHPQFASQDTLKAFMKSKADPAKAFHKEFEKAMQRWMSGLYDQDYEETWLQFRSRCQSAALDLLRRVTPAENVLIFTSGGPIVTLMQTVLGFQDSMVVQLNGAVVNASMTRLPFKDEQLFVAFFNDYAHFETTSPHLITHR